MRSASATPRSTTWSRGHHAVHEPERERAVGVDRVAGHRQLERDRERHALGQADQAAGRGHEPTLHLGDPEARGVGRDHEVAREHDLEAARERGTVHGRDERLREVARHDAREATLAACDVACPPLRDHLEVGARGEHVARAGEHDRTYLGVGLDLVEQAGHRLADLGADRVARFGRLSVRSAMCAARPVRRRPCRAACHEQRPNPRGDRSRRDAGRVEPSDQQRGQHDHRGAGGGRAQADVVGDLALDDRAERVERAEDHGVHREARARGARAARGAATIVEKLESAPR